MEKLDAMAKAHLRVEPVYTLWGNVQQWDVDTFCAYAELVEITPGGAHGQVWSAHSAGATSTAAIQAAVLAAVEGAQLTLF